MVAFVERYLMMDDDNYESNKAYETFVRQKDIQPIFGGVVWDTWLEDDHQHLPTLYNEKGIDYVRLHCNFGNGNTTIGGVSQFTSDNNPLFGKLAGAAKECQVVPLILLQVPWRDVDSDMTISIKL